jgi:hypothetical protein
MIIQFMKNQCIWMNVEGFAKIKIGSQFDLVSRIKG